MAGPKIAPSRTPSTYSVDDTKPDAEIKDEEKDVVAQGSDEHSSSSGLSSEDAIDWRYLTWDTELPPPAFLSSPNVDSANLPSPSTYEKYINPFEWSESRKTFTTWLSCAATVVTAYTAGSYTAGYDQMMAEWNVGRVAITVGVTTFTTGFAIAPMVLAPFSEINGRRPMFVVTGVMYVILQLCCAVTRSFPGMIVARFWTGCFSSTFSTMVGGVVSDIYHAEDRNTAMALFSGAALFGTGLGPMLSAFVATYTSWRWIFYAQVIACGMLMTAIVFFFKETRGSVLLSRKAKALNKYYEALEAQGIVGVELPISPERSEKTTRRIRWKVKSDEERVSIARMIGISVYRPFHLLFTEPTVFFFSLWISFSWAVLYLTFAAIPLVFETNHGFTLFQSGAVFAALSIAAIISVPIAIYGERLTKRWFPAKAGTPEGRLYLACAQSVLLPIGLFWFGWTSFPSIPWIVPTLGIGCATMGIFSIYLAVFNYLADTYHRYASSALAAQSFCRNMLGGIFPLVTDQMFKRMTFQGAGSFLGGVGMALTLVPFVLLIWGQRIRSRSKFASEIMNN